MQAAAEASDGAVSIRLRPRGWLDPGGEGSFDGLARGETDLALGVPGGEGAWFARASLAELPGFGRNAAEATRRLWRSRVDLLVDDDGRARALGLWLGDRPILMSPHKPVRRIADLAGFRVAVRSPVQAQALAALGATPVTVPVLADALEDGIVDGVLASPSRIESAGLDALARFFTVGLPFGRPPAILAVATHLWRALPPAERAAIEHVSGAAWSLAASAALERAGAEALARLRRSPLHQVIELSPGEVARGARRLAKVRGRLAAALERRGVPAGRIISELLDGRP